MKIYATRVVAPEKGQHGTKWQVVTNTDGVVETWDRVEVSGNINFITLDDEGENPRVFAEPDSVTQVFGIRDGARTWIQ